MKFLHVNIIDFKKVDHKRVSQRWIPKLDLKVGLHKGITKVDQNSGPQKLLQNLIRKVDHKSWVDYKSESQKGNYKNQIKSDLGENNIQ